MGGDVEKNAYIRFVDERDFKKVSVEGKRKSKKNRAVRFVLAAFSAKFERERRNRKRLQQWNRKSCVIIKLELKERNMTGDKKKH